MNAVKLGKRELNRQNNHKAIIEAARECFSEAGFDKVTVRDIIRRTGLASGTFYNYFPDKQSIFSALIEDYLERLNTHLKSNRQDAKTLEQFINSSYMAIFSAISEDPIIYRLVHANDKIVQDIYGSSIFGLALDSLEADIKSAIDQNILPELNVDFLAASFCGVGAELGLRLAETEGDPKQAAFFATKLFLGGMQEIGASQTK